MAFKGGVVIGTISFNATGSGTTAIGATSNTGTISIGNTSSGAVSINCGTAGITVGTTANAHASTFGSTNSTSSTTVQSGTGALNVTATNGTLTVNSGTGDLNVANDATVNNVNLGTGAAGKTVIVGSSSSTTAIRAGGGALTLNSNNQTMNILSGTGLISMSGDSAATTVNLGTGAAAKTVTVGSTNTTSSLGLKYGTSDFSLASATGNVMVAQDTGEINYPLQSAFQGYLATGVTNQTGDGTQYTVVFDTEIFDQNSDFSTATGIFTAPVTGKYFFYFTILANNLGVAHTNFQAWIQTTSNSFYGTYNNGFPSALSGGLSASGSAFVSLTATQTAKVVLAVAGSTKTVGVNGVSGSIIFSQFGGYLVC